MPKTAIIKASGVTLLLIKDIEAVAAMHQIGPEELAARLGVSRQTWANWREGRNIPPLTIIERVARLIKVKPSALYEGVHKGIMNNI